MAEPFAMVRMTTEDIINAAGQWENSPGSGPGSYKHYWNACLEAGAYVRVNDVADYYWFHPEKLSGLGIAQDRHRRLHRGRGAERRRQQRDLHVASQEASQGRRAEIQDRRAPCG